MRCHNSQLSDTRDKETAIRKITIGFLAFGLATVACGNLPFAAGNARTGNALHATAPAALTAGGGEAQDSPATGGGEDPSGAMLGQNTLLMKLVANTPSRAR
jgi:hypothetical protein